MFSTCKVIFLCPHTYTVKEGPLCVNRSCQCSKAEVALKPVLAVIAGWTVDFRKS